MSIEERQGRGEDHMIMRARTLDEWQAIGEGIIGPFCTSISGIGNERLCTTASGIFVTVDEHPCVLTAYHVLYGAEGKKGVLASPSLGFWISRGARQPYFPVDTFTPVPIGGPPAGERGPDLAALILPDDLASEVPVRDKAYYNLDLHRARWKEFAVYDDSSAWMLSGAPIEKSVVTDAGIGMEYVLGMCSPPVRSAHEGFEYLDLRASYEAPSDPPQNFEGMSGCGLWALRERPDGAWSRMLMGVAFYQLPRVENLRYVRCHGPADIYGKAYDAILTTVKGLRGGGGIVP